MDMTNNSMLPEVVEPEIIKPEVLSRKDRDGRDAGSVNAAPGGVAVKAGDVTVGTGDIKADKSIGENMTVSGGTVNMTVNNNNSKAVTKASRFDKLPEAPTPAALEAKDKGASLSM